MPLAIIYLASTTDADPLSTFQTLSRPQGLPAIYQAKVYDSEVPKIFMMIHDPNKSSLTNSQVGGLHDSISKKLSPCLCYWQSINSGEQRGSLL